MSQTSVADLQKTELDSRLRVLERNHLIYLAVSYGFSWLFWIGAWLLVRDSAAGDVIYNDDLVWALFFDGGTYSTVLWLSLLSLAGVWGPLIGGIVATRIDPTVSSAGLWRRVRRVGVGARLYGLVFGILLFVGVPAAVAVTLTADPVADAPGLETVLAFAVVFFVFQLFTSGTEEIGWRGYLNEKLMRGRNFWDTGWAVGLPWAVWHYPVVAIMFVQQDMAPPAIIGSLAGYTVGIVALSILHAWFYEQIRSVFLNITIHALFNTFPLVAVLAYEDTPTAVIANLLLWAVVIYMKRRHDRKTPISVESASGP